MSAVSLGWDSLGGLDEGVATTASPDIEAILTHAPSIRRPDPQDNGSAVEATLLVRDDVPPDTLIAGRPWLRRPPTPQLTKASSRATTEPLQEWEGFVTWINGERFGATLFDITEPGELEEMEFSIDEVSRDDLGLLKEGAVFYWTIARHTNEVGTRTNVSIFRLRRLPARTKKARARAEARAGALSAELGIG